MAAKFIIHRKSLLNYKKNLTHHLPDPICNEVYTSIMMERLDPVIKDDNDPDHVAYHKKHKIRGILPVEKVLDCPCNKECNERYAKAFNDFNMISYMELFDFVDECPTFFESWEFATDEDCLKFIDTYMSNLWVKHDYLEEFNTQNLVTQTYEYINSQNISTSKVCISENYRPTFRE